MDEGSGRRIIGSLAACAVTLRSRNLRLVLAAFGLIWSGEWAATVVVGVVAYRHGGSSAVGLVVVARMVPAALIAPVAATVADRGRRERVLAGLGVGRAGTLGAAGLVLVVGGPLVAVYALVAAATVVQTLFRPTHSALLPTLSSTPTELTSANAVRGLLDSVATLAGPLAAALLLTLSGPAAVLFAAAGASALAALLVAGLRYEPPPQLRRPQAGGLAKDGVEGIRAIVTDPALALLTALATLQTFVRGALIVFSVAVAIRLLDSGNAGVGVLTAAIGGGAVVGSLAATLLVGRGGLARWFGCGVVLWGAPLLVLGLSTHWWSAVATMAIIGVGNALVDVGVFTLIGRLADDSMLARVFASFEATITLGAAAGALVTPLLIHELGIRLALMAIGTAVPLLVALSWGALRRIDSEMAVRDSDVALLRHLPMLRVLPEATLEQLAARLTRIEVAAGASVFEQGEFGDDFYVIEAGQALVLVDGLSVNSLGEGEGFGEIALIRDCNRTASVRAATHLKLRSLRRNVFVAAMTGYSPSAEAVDRVIATHIHSTSGSPEPAAAE